MSYHQVTALVAALALAGSAPASDGPAKPAPPVKPGHTVWLEPTSRQVFPQGEAEKQTQMQTGRTLPAPELLQPSLDPALPPYVPVKGLKLRASYRAGSSDVMPSLVEGWVAAFRKYHQEFDLTIERSLAESLGALKLIKGNLELVFVWPGP